MEAYDKSFRIGTERAVPPGETLSRVRPLMRSMGISRLANLTGLDRIGIPVVAACRPNSWSIAVAQGNGLSVEAAQASALMEAVEGFHAERAEVPLLRGSYAALRRRHDVADVAGLPRGHGSRFDEHRPILWATATDIARHCPTLVPYELVHLDWRVPLPEGSGCFFASSNGLASGNVLVEAVSHAICELVERDANTLWHLGGAQGKTDTELDLSTVDDPACRELLERFGEAEVLVRAWDTTSDTGMASILCTMTDADPGLPRPMGAVSGSGCHPRRAIALARALTEAAQGRITLISGARDDLSPSSPDDARAQARAAHAAFVDRSSPPARAFHDVPDVAHDTFEADVRWELERLAGAGLGQVAAVNLTNPDLGVAVVRVVVPHLEAMSEVPGFVPGTRARAAMARRPS